MKHHNFVSYQFVIILFFVILILIIPLAKGDRPESTITNIDLPSFNQGSDIIKVEWTSDTNITKIYFWVCYYENLDSCDIESFDEWKNVKSRSFAGDVKKDTLVNTSLTGSEIIRQSNDKEGQYAIITCVVNITDLTTSEYGEDGVNTEGCEDYGESDGTDFTFVSNKIKYVVFDSTPPELTTYTSTSSSGNSWLEFTDEIVLDWEGTDDSSIVSVKVRYCYWNDILSDNPSQKYWPDDFDSGNTLNLLVNSSMEDGFYYFYPIIFDAAGNPSNTVVSCSEKIEERFVLDTTIPIADIQPEVNEKFVYNSEVLLYFSASDNIELKNAKLVYGYSEEFNTNLLDSSFSADVEIFPLTDLDNLFYEDTVLFNFTNGQGTYRFFFEVDDMYSVSSFIRISLTLVYDLTSPVSNIVFEGEGLDVTNLANYPVNCETTDVGSKVDKVKLYFRYKSNELDSSGIWSSNPRIIDYNTETGICKIDFDSFSEGDGFYEFYTKAIDEAGNEENKEANSELTIIKDSQEPDFELLSIISEGSNFISLNSNTVFYKNLSSNIEIRFIGTLSDELSGINETIDYNNLNWSWDSNIWTIDFTYNISQSDIENNVPLTVFDLAGNPSQIIINFEEDETPPSFFLYNTILDEMLSDEGTLLIRSGITEISIVEVPGNGAAISFCEVKWEMDWITLDSCNFRILEGITNVSIRTTDSLGDSTIKIFKVQHDNQGPEFENLGDWYFNENITYLKESTEIKLNAFDSLSGLDRIEYRLNSDDEWVLYSSDTSLQLFVNGNSDTLFYRAFDKLGNIEEFNETFVLDDDIAEFDFSAVNLIFVSTTDNSSNDKKWDGSEIIDYNSYKTLKISLDDISDNGSGLQSILIEYSTDNQNWKEESEIDLNDPLVFIRITIRDNVGNSYTKLISPIEVINIPIVEETESSKLPLIFFIIILIAGGAAFFYKYKQDQLSGDKDETPKPSPEIKCPNCSVLIPAESKECVFCSSQIDTSASGILASPFSSSEEKIVKEIKPRIGEILIGPDLDRWKIEVGARSSIGGRTNNEDSISWNSFLRTTNDIPHSIRLGVVADGVGGHNKGEVASSLVISAISEFVSKEVNNPYNTEFLTPEAHADILEKAYHYANDIVCKKASFEEYSGMATTAVSVYLWENENGDNVGFLIGNVGDSRGYFINKKTIKQVTKDDSEVQKLIDSGEITEQEAKTHPRKNVITQAIGNKKILKPRIINYSLKDLEFDSILLCSDGVSDKLGDNEIHKIVNQFDNPQDACNRIIKIINRTNTSHDNITLILIKFPNLHPEG